MNDERWTLVDRLLGAALEREPHERDAFLREACGGDEALRLDVESLVTHASSGVNVLSTPAVALAEGIRSARTSMMGRHVGPYAMAARLGAGGMGEVYRARDTKLGRDVAIKILPRVFTTDPDRRARLDREARLLAALNHPHIGAIYGLEELDGTPALILELVEGDTLAERIAKGPIPLTETLRIARQIADALDAAHEKGIVHRDLKPANIKITPDGIVKVLDFGLAKAAAGETSGPDLTQSPTLTIGATHGGVILGTAPYMSPEQARGTALDKRTDVWAFGCVLYEMLTGRVAFAGDTVSDTIATILDREPEWSALSAATPAPVRHLLQRCLEKDPKRRLRDIGDARHEFEETQSGARPGLAAVPAPSRRRERLAWLSGLALVTLSAVVTSVWAFRPAPLVSEVFEISTPPTGDLSMAIAPDGQTLVFVVTSESGPTLWLYSMASGSKQPLAGTEGAAYPFWSPDSRSVGFFAEGKLKRVDVGGGAVQAVASVPAGARDGAWSGDGTILFGMTTGEPIVRVSVAGRTPAAVTPPRQPGMATSPAFLPGGRHFLYHVRAIQEPGVYVAQIDGGEPRRLMPSDSPAVYVPSGQLLFIQQDTLFAQDFDLVRLKLTGDPYPVAGGARNGTVSVSVSGRIAYRPGAGTGVGTAQRDLIWFDRSGREIENAGFPHSGWANPELSRDGLQVAIWRLVSGNFDVWLFDMRRRVLSKLTSDAETDNNPVWSPDGSIVFSSNRTGQFDLYQMSATVEGSEKPLRATGQLLSASDFSSDGRFLLYNSNVPKTTNTDVWALPMHGEGKPFPVAQTSANEVHAQFSPDDKWVAYQSDTSGRREVYLKPFPEGDRTPPISTNGGVQVRWREDGKELFYIAPDKWLMAVQIQVSADGRTAEWGAPEALFLTRVFATFGLNVRQQYVPSADGQRFLVDSVTESVQSPIKVILNWKPRP